MILWCKEGSRLPGKGDVPRGRAQLRNPVLGGLGHGHLPSKAASQGNVSQEPGTWRPLSPFVSASISLGMPAPPLPLRPV